MKNSKFFSVRTEFVDEGNGTKFVYKTTISAANKKEAEKLANNLPLSDYESVEIIRK